MNNNRKTGIGEPEAMGKQSLFHPRHPLQAAPPNLPASMEQGSRRRIRTTIELSVHTLELIQDMQTRHRSQTGKVLPIWKLVGLALESYASSTLAKP